MRGKLNKTDEGRDSESKESYHAEVLLRLKHIVQNLILKCFLSCRQQLNKTDDKRVETSKSKGSNHAEVLLKLYSMVQNLILKCFFSLADSK